MGALAEATPIKRETPRQAIERFFTKSSWKPLPFQRAVWQAYAKGQSGLVHSATGTGKTLSVWLGPILHWLKQNPDRSQWDARKPPPLRVLWITPLRALASDTEASLRAPLDALNIPWRLESRTGDSSSSIKAKQLRSLPTALVTTPESLALMLSHTLLLESLSKLQCVVVDEWHELLGTKRGIQTELLLARLRKLNPQLQVWGLSATLGNLEHAADCLSGANGSPMQIIQGVSKKIDSTCFDHSQTDRSLSVVGSYRHAHGARGG